MQAAHPETSKLTVNFGEKHGAIMPLNLELVIELFSQQQQQLREQLALEYGIEIPKTCIAFEMYVSEGSAKEKAESIEKIKEKLTIFEQIPNNFTTKYSGNKILTVVEAPEFTEVVSSYETFFADLKEEAKSEAYPVTLRLFSNNDLSKIGSEMEKEGVTAWMDSLHLELEFIKNEFTTKMILTFCEQILENDQFSPMIRSFKKFNFELNFASAHYLRMFPKVKRGEKPTLPKTDLSMFLEDAGIERGNLFVMNPTVFMRGNFQATGLSTLMKTVLK